MFLITILWKKKMKLYEGDALFRSVVEGEVFFLLDFERSKDRFTMTK